jgi:hypothetical protein
MSLFDEASLIVTPNAFKASKLYSIKPTDGSGDLSVVRATTKTRTNSLGVIESVPINVASLDYTNGSCPSILVEPQRTNLVLRSEEFDNASWGKINSVITTNSATSPSGNLTADTLSGNGTSGITYLFQSPNVVSNTNYTISVFAKKNQTDFIQIFGSGGFGSTVFANFDLVNGVIGTTGTSNISTNIQNYGNGWYRCSVTALSTQLTGGVFIVPVNSLTAARNPVFNNTNHSIYIWGAQLEAGSNATSYIPTVASAVTRNADVISKTGISDLIGQTEGVIYWEGKIESLRDDIIYINKNTTNSVVILKDANNRINFRIYYGGLSIIIIDLGGEKTGNIKIAGRYKNGNNALYVNGQQIGVNSSFFSFTTDLSDLFISSAPFFFAQNTKNIKQAIIFKTALSDTELQQLTTL